MTFLEALEEAKKGKKIYNKNWLKDIFLTIENGNIKICNTPATCLIKDDYTSNSWEIYKEKILTDEEKEYISNVIKPFKNRVCYIIKYTNLCALNEEYIQICVKSYNNELDEDINLPIFVEGSMYKNMKKVHRYSLKELDL